MPRSEVDVSEDIVARLVARQFPELRGATVRLLDEGWDNVMFRVGADHVARLPRRTSAVALLQHEQRWLPRLAPRLDVAVPVPVHVGRPESEFPWPWSIVPWIEGVPADADDLDLGESARLGRVLRSLHRPAPEDAPSNPFRGVVLADRAESVARFLERLAAVGYDVDRFDRWWADGLAATRHAEEVWLHGDLHPRNIIVNDGRLAGIIDWGDLCRGDAATDLSMAWTVLSEEGRQRFFEGYGPVEEELERRARAWAVFFASALATTDEERHRRMGVGIVESLLR